MPSSKQPPNKSPQDDLAEIRKLRERVEALRLDVARLEGSLDTAEALLNGRLDAIETFLKLDIQTWQPTETQKEFAKKMGFNLPD
jgi:hypothetical protein